jgi:hypothetical protein
MVCGHGVYGVYGAWSMVCGHGVYGVYGAWSMVCGHGVCQLINIDHIFIVLSNPIYAFYTWNATNRLAKALGG